MQTQTFSTRHLARTVAVVAIVAVLAVMSLQRAGATQSNGSSLNQMVEFQIALCEAGGGKATVEVDRTIDSSNTGVVVSCTGGLLDGMWCYTTTAGTACSYNLPNPGGSKGSQAVHTVNEVPADQVLTPLDETADPGSADQPAIEPSEAVDGTVEAGQDEPATDGGAGTVVDQPEVVDASTDPVVADPVGDDLPVVEDAPVVEPVEESAPVVLPAIETISGQELPVLIGQ